MYAAPKVHVHVHVGRCRRGEAAPKVRRNDALCVDERMMKLSDIYFAAIYAAIDEAISICRKEREVLISNTISQVCIGVH